MNVGEEQPQSVVEPGGLVDQSLHAVGRRVLEGDPYPVQLRESASIVYRAMVSSSRLLAAMSGTDLPFICSCRL